MDTFWLVLEFWLIGFLIGCGISALTVIIHMIVGWWRRK